MLSLAKTLNDATTYALKVYIVEKRAFHGDMSEKDIATKMVCFSVNGGATFQDCRIGVIVQLAE